MSCGMRRWPGRDDTIVVSQVTSAGQNVKGFLGNKDTGIQRKEMWIGAREVFPEFSNMPERVRPMNETSF